MVAIILGKGTEKTIEQPGEILNRTALLSTLVFLFENKTLQVPSKKFSGGLIEIIHKKQSLNYLVFYKIRIFGKG